MSELISIIVPVYNAERYLEECIDSIINNTYKNIEVILVDDGSKDSSGEMCDNYALNDERVKVIHQPNGGVSKARNRGMEVASGEYLMFVDSDDYIGEDYIFSYYSAIQSNGCDMCVGGAEMFYKNAVLSIPCFPEGVYLSYDFVRAGIIEYESAISTPWAKLFKSSYAKQIKFNENMKYAEDTLFVMHYLKYANSVASIGEKTEYYYRMRESGASYNNSLTEYGISEIYNAISECAPGMGDTAEKFKRKWIIWDWYAKYCSNVLKGNKQRQKFRIGDFVFLLCTQQNISGVIGVVSMFMHPMLYSFAKKRIQKRELWR